jgi:hypothetical protein
METEDSLYLFTALVGKVHAHTIHGMHRGDIQIQISIAFQHVGRYVEQNGRSYYNPFRR